MNIKCLEPVRNAWHMHSLLHLGLMRTWGGCHHLHFTVEEINSRALGHLSRVLLLVRTGHFQGPLSVILHCHPGIPLQCNTGKKLSNQQSHLRLELLTSQENESIIILGGHRWYFSNVVLGSLLMLMPHNQRLQTMLKESECFIVKTDSVVYILYMLLNQFNFIFIYYTFSC